MQALDRGSSRTVPRWLAATAAVYLVLVVGGSLVKRNGEMPGLPQMTADEIAVITGEDELELNEELEFYIWLEREDKA